jgi:mannose-1-phosphate guanylyltransferase
MADRIILLGVEPDGWELDYGWIQPGETLAWSAGHRVQGVQAFIEKPTSVEAARAMGAGALWNTLVLAAKVETLWKLGWRYFPEMMPLFERLGSAIGTTQEGAVLDSVYQEMPARDFSADLLQRAADQTAVIELSGVHWSDWGRSERIADTLRRIGKQPAFPLECLATA